MASSRNMFSPAWIYNQLNKTRNCNGGLYVVGALDLVTRQGVLDLERFPYRASNCDRIPSADAMQDAFQYRIAAWSTINVQSTIDIKSHLTAGFPVVVGLEVTDSFRRYRGSRVFANSNGVPIGGRAMVAVGYDDRRKAFRLINSWGQEWGDGGYVWIDYDAFRRMAREGYVAQDVVLRHDPPQPPPTPVVVALPRPIPPAPQPNPSEQLASRHIYGPPHAAVLETPSPVLPQFLYTHGLRPGAELSSVYAALMKSGIKVSSEQETYTAQVFESTEHLIWIRRNRYRKMREIGPAVRHSASLEAYKQKSNNNIKINRMSFGSFQNRVISISLDYDYQDSDPSCGNLVVKALDELRVDKFFREFVLSGLKSPEYAEDLGYVTLK